MMAGVKSGRFMAVARGAALLGLLAAAGAAGAAAPVQFTVPAELKDAGVDDDVVEAIRLHNEVAHPGEKRRAKFHHALAAGETITGLIIASALVYPDKKLSNVKTKSVTKRMKEKAFARSVNREIIMECEKIGLDLNRFAEIALQAMQGISSELGL